MPALSGVSTGNSLTKKTENGVEGGVMRLLLQMFCTSGLRIYSQKIYVNGLDISPRIIAKGDV